MAKRRPVKQSAARQPLTKVKIGFAQVADAVFKKQAEKVREGLLKKLRELALHPEAAKPLRHELAGCYTLSYGRIRCIVRRQEHMPVLLVLWLGPRKGSSKDDPYEVATQLLADEGDDIEALFMNYVQAYLIETELERTKQTR